MKLYIFTDSSVNNVTLLFRIIPKDLEDEDLSLYHEIDFDTTKNAFVLSWGEYDFLDNNHQWSKVLI